MKTNYGIASNPNYLINGDMRISQRKDYTLSPLAVHNTYTLDRWKYYQSGVASNISQLSTNQPDSLPGGKSLRSATSAGTGSGLLLLRQIIEDYSFFKGKMVTYSAYVKSDNVNARLIIYDGVTYTSSNTHTGSNTWELLSLTVLVSSVATQIACECGIYTAAQGAVSMAAADYVEFTGAKLELGSSVTKFQQKLLAEELALCQRYCFAPVDNSGAPSDRMASGQNVTTTSGAVTIHHPVTMRVVPILSVSNVAHFTLTNSGGSGIATTNLTLNSTSTENCSVLIGTVAAGLVAGDATLLTTANASATIYLDAEL